MTLSTFPAVGKRSIQVSRCWYDCVCTGSVWALVQSDPYVPGCWHGCVCAGERCDWGKGGPYVRSSLHQMVSEHGHDSVALQLLTCHGAVWVSTESAGLV